jgi:hypothetical protein
MIVVMIQDENKENTHPHASILHSLRMSITCQSIFFLRAQAHQLIFYYLF